MSLLLDPQRRAAMASAAREHHAHQFRVERMIVETAAVYDEIASTREA